MCVHFRLLHEILKSLFLQKSFFLLLLLFFQFFIKFFSFTFSISHFLISFSPELLHFLGKFSGTHHRFLGKPLSSHSSLPNFFEAILRNFLIIILLISLELLIHPICFWDIFLYDIVPSPFYVLRLLLVFGFFGGILDFFPLIKYISHVSFINLFLVFIISYEVWIEL